MPAHHAPERLSVPGVFRRSRGAGPGLDEHPMNRLVPTPRAWSGASTRRTGAPQALWSRTRGEVSPSCTPRPPGHAASSIAARLSAYTGGRRDPTGARTQAAPSPQGVRRRFATRNLCTASQASVAPVARGAPRPPRAARPTARASGPGPRRRAPARGCGPGRRAGHLRAHRSEPLIVVAPPWASRADHLEHVAGEGAPHLRWLGRSVWPLTPTALRHGPPAIEAMASRTEATGAGTNRL